MPLKTEQYQGQVQRFDCLLDEVAQQLMPYQDFVPTEQIYALKQRFLQRTQEFFRQDRQLNLAVLGQVKAGKSSFLNTLLFEGREVLPKAATPKTAVLTRVEYADQDELYVEYYTKEEWETLEAVANVPVSTDTTRAAQELVYMAIDRGTNVSQYLAQKSETIPIETQEQMQTALNRYVSENGDVSPVVKNVTLRLHRPELQGIVVVDTPGLNDPVVSRTEKTKQYLQTCDAAFFLSRSGHFLDESDLALLTKQLPQKGLKKMYLVASLYDEVLTDGIYDDISLQDADQNIKAKLRRHATYHLSRAIAAMQRQHYPTSMIAVVEACKYPIFVSVMAKSMAEKPRKAYCKKEQIIYQTLNYHGDCTPEMLQKIANFDAVQNIFKTIVWEKEEMLREKAESFVMFNQIELWQLLQTFIDKIEQDTKVAQEKRTALENNRKKISQDVVEIRHQLAQAFHKTDTMMQQSVAEASFRLRQMSKSATVITPHTAVKVLSNIQEVSDAVFYNPLSWGKRHKEYEVVTKSYEYLHVSDAEQTATQMQLCAGDLWSQIQENLENKAQLQRDISDVFVTHYQRLGIPYTERMIPDEVAAILKTCLVAPVDFSAVPDFSALQEKYQKRVRKEERQKQLKADLSLYMEALTTYLVTQFSTAMQATLQTYMQAQETLSHRCFLDFKDLLSEEMQKIAENERVLRKYNELQEVLVRYYVVQ